MGRGSGRRGEPRRGGGWGGARGGGRRGGRGRARLGAGLRGGRGTPEGPRERTAAEAAPRERLVASTVVSSTMLAKIAAAAGARYAETLTGFKWIARAADDRPGTRFIFGSEEARQG